MKKEKFEVVDDEELNALGRWYDEHTEETEAEWEEAGRRGEIRAIDPAYYENNCLADEFMEAERNGDLLSPRDGKNAIEVVREHMLAKKKSGGGLSAARAAVLVAARGGG